MWKSLDSIRILVVDDSSMIRHVVTLMLNSYGFKNIDCAENLTVALSKVETLDSNYDLILLDRYLGEESGLEVLKAVRHRKRKVPILMLTQEHEGKKVIEAISDGASDYIVKPFSEEILIEKVKKALLLS